MTNMRYAPNGHPYFEHSKNTITSVVCKVTQQQPLYSVHCLPLYSQWGLISIILLTFFHCCYISGNGANCGNCNTKGWVERRFWFFKRYCLYVSRLHLDWSLVYIKSWLGHVMDMLWKQKESFWLTRLYMELFCMWRGNEKRWRGSREHCLNALRS